MKPAGRPQTGDATGRETIEDVSGVPPVPTGGPGVPALLAAAGVGYGEGFAANSHELDEAVRIGPQNAVQRLLATGNASEAFDEEMQKFAAEGYRFFLYSADVFILRQKLQEFVASVPSSTNDLMDEAPVGERSA